MQIHPHFLFNTLNTMYGFALRKADEAPEMILKLSNLLDYLLYKVDKPFVLITDEINHIKDYIELEKLASDKNYQAVPALMRLNGIESGKMWQKLRDDMPAEIAHDNS